MEPTLRTDTRAVSQAVAVGVLLGSAFVLALALAVFMLAG
jgi:uncharacterized protein (DUF2062 family)